MIKCECCGFECDCMDLYYDHIMFDNRHHLLAQNELYNTKKKRRSAYRSAYSSRSSSTSTNSVQAENAISASHSYLNAEVY
ncbi:hypothetical protein EC988_000033 [Linderina pennispora]|nr:hypothetical protein EC988_000033 [Linderina pennispora]